MYVRLAFAVAAHLEPEILIVDEVLAVGDAEFQKKCLGKMQRGQPRRPHGAVRQPQHGAVENLCHRAVLLDGGRVSLAGAPGEVIAAYASHVSPASLTQLLDRTDREGTGVIRFAEVRLRAEDGQPVQGLVAGANAILDLHMRNVDRRAHRSVHVSIGINSAMGQRVTTWSTTYAGGDLPVTPSGDFVLRLQLPRIALIPGNYTLQPVRHSGWRHRRLAAACRRVRGSGRRLLRQRPASESARRHVPQRPLLSAAMIAFCTSLRARALSRDWAHHTWLLDTTIYSMLAQQQGEVRVVVGCHDIPDSRWASDPRVRFEPVTIAHPDRTFDDMSVDKVVKHSVAARWAIAQGADYVGFNDADDLVSDRVGVHVAANRGENGWYTESQWLDTHGATLRGSSTLLHRNRGRV